jgi:hypothetical protein
VKSVKSGSARKRHTGRPTTDDFEFSLLEEMLVDCRSKASGLAAALS